MPHNKRPAFFNRLAVRQGVVILALALSLGLSSSLYLVAKEAKTESLRLHSEVETLMNVQAASAAQASYNYDFAEAQIIAESLLKFPLVQAASITNEVGETIAGVEKTLAKQPSSRITRYLLETLYTPSSVHSIQLKSPASGENVGILRIKTDLTPIAEELMQEHAMLFLYEISRAVLLALLLGLFFYHRMTKPLLGIAAHVTRVDPTLPAISPVPMPSAHNHNELGNMVRSINKLFAVVSVTLFRKDELEHSLMQMNMELEQRVQERTTELQDQSEALRNEIINRAIAESNLRAHHNLLDNLFEKMKAAIIIFNPLDHEIVEMNTVAGTMLELPQKTPLQSPEVLDSLQFITGTTSRRLCEYSSGIPSYEEGQLQLQDNKSLPMAKYTFSMTINGQPHVALILMDISEKKNLEHQLGIAQRLESIGLLASGIAHEINTPIQYIHDNMVFLREVHANQTQLNALYEQLCKKAETIEPLKETCGAIQKACSDLDIEFARQELPRVFDSVFEGIERVVSIVSAMKRFAHSGPQTMMAADLNAALLTTIQVAKNEWKYVSEVATDLETDLPPVECISAEMNQVFLNILINAAHAIKDVVGDSGRKGTISISSRHEGDKVFIRFSDSGCGIPESIAGKIFDQFFTTKEPGRGTGQGLAIVHNIIVKKHNGEIKVDSAVGKGTTFTLVLPVSQHATSAS